ncbi:S1C family serine protease [Cytobacillus firmus]|uniref:S1C family serine protease n=1 Tax=Cytobacillus firmus TaxID=1399 RepID=UPI0018CFC526|nr:S1C family serine protease [Cytobacillus firmus]
MKKLLAVLLVFMVIFGMFTPSSNAEDKSFCDQFKGIKKIWWDGIELKSGQIGRLTILKDTSLFKLQGEKKVFTRTLKKGEFYRIYAFKPGKLSVGGGYFVDRDVKVSYSTPSKNKLAAVACINGSYPSQNSSPKVYTTKEIVDQNDDKVVLIETNRSQGSGIVVGNGLILTNHHVMEGASQARVTFNNGQQFEVQGIVESDPNKDIAIIKTVKTFNKSSVSIRSSSQGLSKGEKVVAIGSPEGLQNTVSEGIISSFRSFNGVSHIQTNAEITFGSSGGGLFSTSGQLIGITTSGIGDANLNFAVASEEFVPVVNRYAKLTHGSIKASFPKISISLLGGISLGMTKQQVKQQSSGMLLEEGSDKLVFQNVSVLDYPANVIYEFDNNILTAVNVYHNIAENVGDLSLLEDYFINIYQKITPYYGEPEHLDTDWMDDEEGYVLSAYWTAVDHDTMLIVQITFDYDSYGGLRISIRQ